MPPRPTRVAAAVSRLRPATLRARVVAVLVVALLVGYGTVGVVTNFALRDFLKQQLDEQLISAAGRNMGHLRRGELPEGTRVADPQAPPGFGSVVGQPEGAVGAVVVNGSVAAFGVVGSTGSYAEARSLIASVVPDGDPVTRTLPGLGEYRLVAVRASPGLTLVTGLSQHSLELTVQRLMLIELVVFAAALLATGLCAAVFVRLSLRPLTKVAATAEQVAGMPLTSGHVHMPVPIANPAPGTEAGQVADAVNRMVAHVENALQQRQFSEDRLRRFVADASHELRTPVAVIRSYAELAERAGGERLDEDVVRALGRIRAQAGRMTGLVEDLLLLARLDSGRPLVHEPVDLTRLVLDAVRDAQVSVPDHVWQLALPDEPVEVAGDERTLAQSVGNLLANAGRHTPAGTTVRVSLSRETDVIRLDVTDDGPGIAPELQPRLFERFVHGAPTGNRGSGHGLGLPIVGAIVQAHGGRVELSSVPGTTTFRIVLPGAAPPDVRPA